VFSPCGFWPTRQRLEYARGYRRFGPCALSLCSVQWPIPSPTRIALHSAFCSLPSILFIRLHPAASGHRKFSMRPQNSKIDRTADAKPGFGHRTAAPWSAGGRADLPVLHSNTAKGGPARRPPLHSQSFIPHHEASRTPRFSCHPSPVTHHPSPVTRHQLVALRGPARIYFSPSRVHRPPLVAPKPGVGGSRSNKITKRTQFQNGVSHIKSSLSNFSAASALAKRTQFCPDIPRGLDRWSLAQLEGAFQGWGQLVPAQMGPSESNLIQPNPT